MKEVLILMMISVSSNCFSQDLSAELEKKIDSVRKSFTEYNEDFFALYRSDGQIYSSAYWDLSQFKNLKINYRKDSLTLIDKLNGIESKGKIKISADAVRRFPTLNNQWGEWISFSDWTISIVKKRGTWRVYTDLYHPSGRVPNRKPTIEMIKDVYNKPMEDNK